MKSSKSTLAVAVLLSVMSTGAFAAEQADKTYYFDEVVVTASGRPETLFTTKSNTQVITSEQIEKMHYKDVKEAVRNVSGVQMSDYGMAGHDFSSNIYMNGSKTVLFMVNGVRASVPGINMLNQPVTYFRQVMSDMDNIERIEVIKGSGSLLYGSEALGGVVNVITKNPDKYKSTVSIEGGNFKHEQYKIATQGREKKTFYRVFAEKYHDGAYKDGKGEKWDSHRNGTDESITIGHEFSEGNKITLDYHHSDEDFGYEDKIGGYSPTDNTFSGKVKTTNFGLTLDNKLTEKITNKLTYNYMKYEMNTNAGDINGYDMGGWFANNKDNEYHENYKGTIVRDVLTYENKDNVLTLGAEYSKASSLKDSSRTIENRAVYLQDNWKFGKGWNLTLGGRYDNAKHQRGSMGRNWAKNANLGYEFNENTNMYVGYNDSFIIPGIAQLYQYGGMDMGLKPTVAHNIEYGINHKITKNDIVSAHYFYRKVKDWIDWTVDYSMPSYGGYANRDDVLKSHGIDIQYDKYYDGHWHTKLGYARTTSGEDNHGFLAKNQINLGVDYTADKWNIGLDVKGYIGRNHGSKLDYSKFPASNYAIVDFSVNYKPSKDVKIYAKVNNLLDKYYAEAFDIQKQSGNWYAMPGRTFIVGMNWSF